MSDVIKNKWSWAIGLLLCVFCAWTGIEAQTPTTDLTTHAPTVTPPSGGVFHWYSSASPSIGTQVANPTAVLPGVYYGAYYFSSSNCYSAVTPLRVATNTCAATTVNLNDFIDNAVTLPANTELRFHSASPVSDANRMTGTAITAASAGTFFISYYNTAGACYTATAGVIVVVLTPCNQAPVITSNGGGATGTQNVAENSTVVTTVTATDPENSFGTPKFKISGGADAAKFSIDPATGILSFVSAPDFESPTDVGANNVYDVQVTVTDAGGLTDVQDVAVTVTNVNESSDTDGDDLTDDIDLDDDNDGILDTVEDGQLSADSDGDGIPNRLDLDSDNDGLNDAIEAGGTDANNDGIADGTPNAQGIPASAGTGLTAPDTDGDTRANPYDLDSDNDGINDVVETGNPALVDANGDGKVDGTDTDGDGILGAADGTPSVRGDANDPNPANTDGTGGPNYVDLDSDGDGLTDLQESGIANPSTLDANGDGKIDNAADADGDGIPQVVDSAPATFGDANNSPLPDGNNNGTPDYVDSDIDCKLSIKVLLQGALFNSATAGIMRDDLRTGGHIPLNDPYSGSGNPRFAHAGSGAAATTTNTVLNANAGTNDAIVDWVFVELRSASNSATVVETRAALLQRDGDVVSPLDGLSPLSFANAAGISYYVGVKHRNHLGAMTASTQTLTMIGTTVDFTTMSDANVFNNAGYDGLEMVTVGSLKALWAGNVNADSKLKYQGTNSENTVVLSQVLNHPNNTSGLYNYNAGFGYYSGDINLDGKVKYQGTASDPGFLFFNVVTTYSLNSSALYNYDLLLEQLP